MNAAYRWALRTWLRIEAWELAHWVRDLTRSGLHDSLHLRACRRRMAEIEVRIATLQPRLRNTRQSRRSTHA
jgi:hypothetical protein